MDKKITIGITGGIGSGKSYVCRIIIAMGYPVFYSDAVAKEILQSDKDAIRQIKESFGPEAYVDNELNKPFIASEIYRNNNLRATINDIVHPKVRDHFRSWAVNQESLIVLNEAAILFETGASENYDYTVIVTAPNQIKINRIKNRDGLTEVQIQKRLDAQWSDEKKTPLASFVVNNDETELLLPQIATIFDKIKEKYSYL